MSSRTWTGRVVRALCATLLGACGGPGDAPVGARREDGRFADLAGPPTRERFRFPAAAPGEPAAAQPPTEAPAAEDGPRRANRAGTSGPELETVARIEVEVPPREHFVLRATLPVPRGFPEPDRERPTLALADRFADGSPRPAQLEVVARRPDGSPAVVELAARVTGGEPGRARFAVVRWKEPPPSALSEGEPAAADPLALFDAAGGVWLRTRDVFGNEYRVELSGRADAPGFGGRRVDAPGPVLFRGRVHGVLLPASGAVDALPHLMGVHAYWTTRAGEAAIALDLRVHNGLTAASGPPAREVAPAGIVYWDALELVLPAGWSARALADDPALGTAYREGDSVVLPLVDPPAGGRLHAMGPQAQLVRRLDLRPEQPGGTTDRAPAQLDGLGFCTAGEGTWSWWEPSCASWFPQRALLADWGELRREGARGRAALRARLCAARDRLRETLARGTAVGVLAGERMGWAHPLGVPIQGMTGGSGIQFFEGHLAVDAAEPAGIELLMLEQRMTACRSPEAQWTLAGEPAGVDAWLDASGRVPFDFRTNGRVVPRELALPCFRGPAASAQVLAVVERGLRPPYDRGTPYLADGKLDGGPDDIYSWMPHDGQHLSRATRLSKALVWAANDELARDDLRLSAELFHLMFHGHEHARASWSEGVTLRCYERLAAEHPHQGLDLGRDQAWGIDAMCAAYAVLDSDWRARHRAWFGRVARLLVDASQPSGIVTRMHNAKILDGRHAAAQAFECALLLHAERCLLESVLRGEDPELVDALEEQLLRAVDYLAFGPVFACVDEPRAPGRVACGPRWQFAVAPLAPAWAAPYSDEAVWGPRYLPQDGLAGGVECLYTLAVLEYAATLSEPRAGTGLENRYLRRILDCGSRFESPAAFLREAFARAARDASEEALNWEGLIGHLQALGVGFR